MTSYQINPKTKTQGQPSVSKENEILGNAPRKEGKKASVKHDPHQSQSHRLFLQDDSSPLNNMIQQYNDPPQQELQLINNEEDKYLIDVSELKSKYIDNNVLMEEGDIIHNTEFMSKLHYDAQMKHPRKIIEGKVTKIPCCSRTGNYCCFKCCRRQSSVDSLGIGQMIYFKLLKALLVALFFVTLINLPIYWVYYSNHLDKIPYSYTEILYKTTIGNIGSTIYNCQSFPIDFTSSMQSFKLDCKNMNVSSIIAFGTAVDDDMERKNNQNCFEYMSISSIEIDKKCLLAKELNDILVTDCNGKSQCEIKYDMRTLQSKCNQSSPDELLTKLYFEYSCYDSYVSLGFQDYKLERNDFGYIVTGIDCLGILILIFTLFVIGHFHKKDLMEYKEKNIFIQHYTLYCDSIVVKKERLNDEVGDLIRHFNSVLMTKEAQYYVGLGDYEPGNEENEAGYVYKNYNKEMKDKMGEENDVKLYEIVYPRLTCEKLDAVKKMHSVQKKLHKKVIEESPNDSSRIGNSIKDPLPNSDRYNERDVVIIPNVSMSINKSPAILKLESEIEEIKKKIDKDTEVTNVKEFYFTFRNQRIANYIQKKYSLSCGKRCCLICFCKKKRIQHLYYKNTWLNLSYAKDEPSNLKWENMTYSPCKRCLRKTFSIFIAILIMLITLVIILIAKAFQAQMAEEFNTTIDCSYLKYITEVDVESECKDKSIPSNERFKTYCFCNNKMSVIDVFTNDLKAYTILGTDIKPCENFIDSYLKYNALNISIIVAIPVVNTIVMTIFKCLTSCERNKTMSKDMRSNMWKIFIITFINTGILLIIINVRIDEVLEKIPTFPFFAGDFKDFDPGWYNRVGVVILFSMLLDIVTPHAASMLTVLLKSMSKCCDSGCSNGKTTKKLTKTEYFDVYTGPVFEIDTRYASLLSSFFVTMMFAPGIPFLYGSFFLNLLITYIIDKILIITFYRNPPKYDLGIISSFIFYSFVAVIIHFLFAIWIYGNPFILVNNSPNRLKEIKEWIDSLFTTDVPMIKDILERLTLGHNMVLVAGFLLIIAILLLSLLVGLLKLLCGCECKGKKEEGASQKNKCVEIGLSVSLRDLHRSYVIKQLEYNQLVKMNETESIKEQKKNLKKGMNYLRLFIIYKIETIKQAKYPQLAMNFNVEIRKIIDLFSLEKKCLIEGDMSYNIVFIPEFESVGYYDYIKKLQ